MLVDVPDDLPAAQLQQQADRHQFRVVEMIDIRVLAHGQAIEPPQDSGHALPPALRLGQRHDAHAGHGFFLVMSSDQHDFVARPDQALGLLMKDPPVKRHMDGGQNADFRALSLHRLHCSRDSRQVFIQPENA
jgi:hypothetical protein